MIIVGAGPAGSCLAYFLGKQGRKILLIEKKVFPRDKYCGDAICKIGIEILHEMGLLQDLISSNKAHVVSIFHSLFIIQNMYSVVEILNGKVINLAPEMLVLLSKSRISLFNAHHTLFVRRMTSYTGF